MLYSISFVRVLTGCSTHYNHQDLIRVLCNSACIYKQKSARSVQEHQNAFIILFVCHYAKFADYVQGWMVFANNYFGIYSFLNYICPLLTIVKKLRKSRRDRFMVMKLTCGFRNVDGSLLTMPLFLEKTQKT